MAGCRSVGSAGQLRHRRARSPGFNKERHQAAGARNIVTPLAYSA
ncbi:MAG: hypothetical protein AVDCRST_MAG09-2355 [uncultured Sphingomonas sp.]|uniref:Uncharacterized protein n=1 Tax=uncultured Sphingomonas sp. TaxID=158754 RepID=A0A6J4THM4_9SPHN|nr:MAG: hypothetical protein AVDCRST_MAG09-2355 [uncultured Sphingomonas sp.]